MAMGLLDDIAALSEGEARGEFAAWRWPDGKDDCPRCGAVEPIFMWSRHLYRCRKCRHEFTATSGTVFHGHKLSYKQIMMAIALFEDNEDISAMEMWRRLGVGSYRTAYVLLKKMREASERGKLDGRSSWRGYWQR